MATDAVQQFGNVSLNSWSALMQGALKIHTGGFIWQKKGGDRKVVEVPSTDIKRVELARVRVMTVWAEEKLVGVFSEFGGRTEDYRIAWCAREQPDIDTIYKFVTDTLGKEVQKREVSVSGRNWGECKIDGSLLDFEVDNKLAFQVNLADVSQSQLGNKTDVQMSFHPDDMSTQDPEADALVEMSIYIPPTCTAYQPAQEEDADEDTPETTAAAVFNEKVLERADVDTQHGEAIIEFEDLFVVVPRGKLNCELHKNYIHFYGVNSSQDFNIQYSNISRVFVLPRTAQEVYVDIALDPPIRRGQTFYPHVLLKFHTDDEIQVELNMEESMIEKCNGKLQRSYEGEQYEVFVKVLKGLSETKVSRPGSFESRDQDAEGACVRCSLKADEGSLFPLERSFFFAPKPPTLVPFDDVDYIEFARAGARSGGAQSSRTFDLVVRLSSGQETQFRNIKREEYSNLFAFISAKGLRIINMQDAAQDAAAVQNQESDEDSDFEDDDFVEGEGSDEDDEEEEEEDGDEDDEEEEEERPRKPKATKAAPKRSSAKEGAPKKRAKKDPNAPKRALSAYFFFAGDARKEIMADNPGMPVSEVSKIMGERWKEMSAEDKEPYEEMAKDDKDRYNTEMAEYKASR